MIADVVGSAIGFTTFNVLLSAWALTFAIGGERLFGPVWGRLVMYNVADRLGLTDDNLDKTCNFFRHFPVKYAKLNSVFSLKSTNQG
ncbi:hypothetical protein GIB67_029805 [Kingdonia uniflora]|uniref:Uncharacterized protein n=1 Tax=Kingdonia uniflora TaxID=39325 RepID=A0A7J7NJ17_9MAGN|nr:hypothetical protein GIB67_029805 [Kingdonia uniflora]